MADVAEIAQPKLAKIYGAGGLSGLEAYQTGVVVSSDGLVLTVWSTVLDASSVRVVLADGRRADGEVLGADVQLGVALLKIDVETPDYFRLNEPTMATGGVRVLALSNCFGVAAGAEPLSVQHGVVLARAPLAARRGIYRTPYRGDVYLLDAVTSNPGAAGGAITDFRGRLLGLIGKELRDSRDNTWLNYALPVDVLGPAVDRILSGETSPLERAADAVVDAWSLAELGLVLAPEVLDRTPPFVDAVWRDGPAEAAGLRPDDLVLYVQNELVATAADMRRELGRRRRFEPLSLVVLRGGDLVTLEVAPQ